MSVSRKFDLHLVTGLRDDLLHEPNPAALDQPLWRSKEVLDTVNSVCWLFMDAFWMFGVPHAGLVLAVPTLLTAFMMMYIERKRFIFWFNFATTCWLTMNILWLMADLFPHQKIQFMIGSKTSFILGLVFIGIGLQRSRHLKGTVYKQIKSPRAVDSNSFN